MIGNLKVGWICGLTYAKAKHEELYADTSYGRCSAETVKAKLERDYEQEGSLFKLAFAAGSKLRSLKLGS